MITEEDVGNMKETEMNVEQAKGPAHASTLGFSEVLKEQQQQGERHELKPQAPLSPPPPPPSSPSPVDDERRAVNSEAEADEKETEGEHSTEEMGSTPDKPEAREELPTTDQVHVVVVSSMEESLTLTPPVTPPVTPPDRTPGAVLPAGVEDNKSPTAPDSPDIQGLPSVSNAAAQDDLTPPAVVSSPGKKRSKKKQSWKKNAGKKKQGRDSEEQLPAESRDAGTQTDQLELERNANEPEFERNAASGMAQQSAAEAHETGFKSKSEEGPHREGGVDENELTKAVGVEDDPGVEEEKLETAGPSFGSLKALRSFGRWADVSEEVDTRAFDTELEESPSGDIRADKSSDHEEQELRGKSEQGFEGQQSEDIRTGTRSSPQEQVVRGPSQEGVEGSPRGSPREDIRAGTRSNHKEQELRGKTQQQSLEGSNSQEARSDTWRNQKEQDLRGKGQLGREPASQASRESNWRRRPMDSRLKQDSPRSPSKLGLDGDTKKDEQQDFRSRTQFGAEPQATHKNWIPRRGIQRAEGEGRAEQNKARGKGKQGREAGPGPQNALAKDSARQKFDADLRLKQEELLQKSKQSLRAEIQKVKRMEQARKGRDELETDLNKNLVYEDGDLFYLNL